MRWTQLSQLSENLKIITLKKMINWMIQFHDNIVTK